MTKKEKLLQELGFEAIPRQIEDGKTTKTNLVGLIKEKALKRIADKMKIRKS